MADEASFLEAIISEPDDDSLRLIFADWLDERGDPRGKFIRVQIELARLSADDPRLAPLKDRECELLGRHKIAWLGPIGDLVGEARFGRGLLESIDVTSSAFLEYGDALFHLQPFRDV